MGEISSIQFYMVWLYELNAWVLLVDKRGQWVQKERGWAWSLFWDGNLHCYDLGMRHIMSKVLLLEKGRTTNEELIPF